MAQQIAEPRDHAYRGWTLLGAHQASNRVKRVVEEVRAEAHFEGAELGHRELRLQLGNAQPAIVIEAVEANGETGGQRREIAVDVDERLTPKPPRDGPIAAVGKVGTDDAIDDAVHRRDDDAENDVE